MPRHTPPTSPKSPKPTFLPAFKIRNLPHPRSPTGQSQSQSPSRTSSPSSARDAVVQITGQAYDRQIQHVADSKLFYDDSDGDKITVGSAIELEQKLAEPVRRARKTLVDQNETGRSESAPSSPIMHSFNINQSASWIWNEIEEQTSQHRNEQQQQSQGNTQQHNVENLQQIPGGVQSFRLCHSPKDEQECPMSDLIPGFLTSKEYRMPQPAAKDEQEGALASKVASEVNVRADGTTKRGRKRVAFLDSSDKQLMSGPDAASSVKSLEDRREQHLQTSNPPLLNAPREVLENGSSIKSYVNLLNSGQLDNRPNYHSDSTALLPAAIDQARAAGERIRAARMSGAPMLPPSGRWGMYVDESRQRTFGQPSTESSPKERTDEIVPKDVPSCSYPLAKAEVEEKPVLPQATAMPNVTQAQMMWPGNPPVPFSQAFPSISTEPSPPQPLMKSSRGKHYHKTGYAHWAKTSKRPEDWTRAEKDALRPSACNSKSCLRPFGAERACQTCCRRMCKCDEGHPACTKCSKDGLVCEGYTGPQQTHKPGVETCDIFFDDHSSWVCRAAACPVPWHYSEPHTSPNYPLSPRVMCCAPGRDLEAWLFSHGVGAVAGYKLGDDDVDADDEDDDKSTLRAHFETELEKLKGPQSPPHLPSRDPVTEQKDAQTLSNLYMQASDSIASILDTLDTQFEHTCRASIESVLAATTEPIGGRSRHALLREYFEEAHHFRRAWKSLDVHRDAPAPRCRADHDIENEEPEFTESDRLEDVVDAVEVGMETLKILGRIAALVLSETTPAASGGDLYEDQDPPLTLSLVSYDEKSEELRGELVPGASDEQLAKKLGEEKAAAARADGEKHERPPVVFARARYDFKGAKDKELDLRAGDIIRVVTQHESGWWDGVLNGRRGWFPRNWCTVVDIVDAAEQPQSQRNASQQPAAQIRNPAGPEPVPKADEITPSGSNPAEEAIVQSDDAMAELLKLRPMAIHYFLKNHQPLQPKGSPTPEMMQTAQRSAQQLAVAPIERSTAQQAPGATSSSCGQPDTPGPVTVPGQMTVPGQSSSEAGQQSACKPTGSRISSDQHGIIPLSAKQISAQQAMQAQPLTAWQLQLARQQDMAVQQQRAMERPQVQHDTTAQQQIAGRDQRVMAARIRAQNLRHAQQQAQALSETPAYSPSNAANDPTIYRAPSTMTPQITSQSSSNQLCVSGTGRGSSTTAASGSSNTPVRQRAMEMYSHNMAAVQRNVMRQAGAMPGQAPVPANLQTNASSHRTPQMALNSRPSRSAVSVTPKAFSSKHALEDYHVQLMLLERQNRHRLMRAKGEPVPAEETTEKIEGEKMRTREFEREAVKEKQSGPPVDVGSGVQAKVSAIQISKPLDETLGDCRLSGFAMQWTQSQQQSWMDPVEARAKQEAAAASQTGLPTGLEDRRDEPSVKRTGDYRDHLIILERQNRERLTRAKARAEQDAAIAEAAVATAAALPEAGREQSEDPTTIQAASHGRRMEVEMQHKGSVRKREQMTGTMKTAKGDAQTSEEPNGKLSAEAVKQRQLEAFQVALALAKNHRQMLLQLGGDTTALKTIAEANQVEKSDTESLYTKFSSDQRTRPERDPKRVLLKWTPESESVVYEVELDGIRVRRQVDTNDVEVNSIFLIAVNRDTSGKGQYANELGQLCVVSDPMLGSKWLQLSAGKQAATLNGIGDKLFPLFEDDICKYGIRDLRSEKSSCAQPLYGVDDYNDLTQQKMKSDRKEFLDAHETALADDFPSASKSWSTVANSSDMGEPEIDESLEQELGATPADELSQGKPSDSASTKMRIHDIVSCEEDVSNVSSLSLPTMASKQKRNNDDLYEVSEPPSPGLVRKSATFPALPSWEPLTPARSRSVVAPNWKPLTPMRANTTSLPDSKHQMPGSFPQDAVSSTSAAVSPRLLHRPVETSGAFFNRMTGRMDNTTPKPSSTKDMAFAGNSEGYTTQGPHIASRYSLPHATPRSSTIPPSFPPWQSAPRGGVQLNEFKTAAAEGAKTGPAYQTGPFSIAAKTELGPPSRLTRPFSVPDFHHHQHQHQHQHTAAPPPQPPSFNPFTRPNVAHSQTVHAPPTSYTQPSRASRTYQPKPDPMANLHPATKRVVQQLQKMGFGDEKTAPLERLIFYAQASGSDLETALDMIEGERKRLKDFERRNRG